MPILFPQAARTYMVAKPVLEVPLVVLQQSLRVGQAPLVTAVEVVGLVDISGFSNNLGDEGS